MKVQIIVGTTRQGRVTDRAAAWVAKAIEQDGKAQAEIVDLVDYPMEFFVEPGSPQYTPDRQPSVGAKKWLDKLVEADAYVIVTPEYNRAIPAVLKNALDNIDFQLSRKPVAIVSHGGVGGAFASSNLRLILPQLDAVAVPATVYMTGASQLLNEQGELSAEVANSPYGPQTALKKVLDELYWLTEAIAAK